MISAYNVIGTQIGNYLIEAYLATGGCSHVYRARHRLLTNRIVAIKLLHGDYLTSQKERARFLQEACLLEQLKGPHIVSILDAGLRDSIPYIVTTYLPNGSLVDRLACRFTVPLSIEETMTTLSQIGQALQTIHWQNIIHCDLKPANILFNAEREALLADFGIALSREATAEYIDPIGTPAYMAPEQFRGRVSQCSDHYALGCIAYKLVTGQRPFAASDPIVLDLRHQVELPLPPTFYNPSLSKQSEHVILKAMAKHQRDRYTDVATFISALLGFTMSEPERDLVKR